jgi:hypothetical protein
MIILMTLLIAGASMAFAVHQWWRGYHPDSDRSLHSHGSWLALP